MLTLLKWPFCQFTFSIEVPESILYPSFEEFLRCICLSGARHLTKKTMLQTAAAHSAMTEQVKHHQVLGMAEVLLEPCNYRGMHADFETDGTLFLAKCKRNASRQVVWRNFVRKTQLYKELDIEWKKNSWSHRRPKLIMQVLIICKPQVRNLVSCSPMSDSTQRLAYDTLIGQCTKVLWCWICKKTKAPKPESRLQLELEAEKLQILLLHTLIIHDHNFCGYNWLVQIPVGALWASPSWTIFSATWFSAQTPGEICQALDYWVPLRDHLWIQPHHTTQISCPNGQIQLLAWLLHEVLWLPQASNSNHFT